MTGTDPRRWRDADPTGHDDSLEALLSDHADDQADDDGTLLADQLAASFAPIDLATIVGGASTRPEPTILRRDDAQCLFYPGQINGIHGDSGVGKGWVTLFAVAQQIRAGRTVLMLDAEDVPESIVSRLRTLGATDHEILTRLLYVRPVDPFGIVAMERLTGLLVEHRPSLVIVDSLGECFGLDGIDENHDAEVGPWLRRVARRIADHGPAVVLVDHSTKANDNPLHPSGSKRKRAAIGGASYLVTATTPLTAASGGRLRLQCAKDRHGTYARGEHVADFVMRTDPITGTTVDLYSPSPRTDTQAQLAPIVLEVVRDRGPVSMRGILADARQRGATGRDRAFHDTIEVLVLDGELIESCGAKRSRLFHAASQETTTDEDAEHVESGHL